MMNGGYVAIIKDATSSKRYYSIVFRIVQYYKANVKDKDGQTSLSPGMDVG